jgi:hypothetical protein
VTLSCHSPRRPNFFLRSHRSKQASVSGTHNYANCEWQMGSGLVLENCAGVHCSCLARMRPDPICIRPHLHSSAFISEIPKNVDQNVRLRRGPGEWQREAGTPRARFRSPPSCGRTPRAGRGTEPAPIGWRRARRGPAASPALRKNSPAWTRQGGKRKPNELVRSRPQVTEELPGDHHAKGIECGVRNSGD